ncbi:hypothetical protein FISHEDRAFT_74077 [Fistulina hepatica ATCC 64428]|uniref:Uncharacterized protein n=1 Tax=Fistulina hepatica ATCC 64428 TaxID=1128425 RepID=A0A0D7ABG8_9AGAR|nr:hypothetical protein FISHEDRAFT_74077 [Fistulina hepatica ATCC 64428]
MHCQGFGSRAFRLEEAWMSDSLSVFRGGARTTAIQGGTSDKLQPDLFSITLEALRSYFLTSVQQQQRYVAAMFLDSARDPKTGRIVGHTAVTLMPALNDMRPVDQRYCDIDAEGKTYWMAANIGIGAWMHEVNHSVCAIEPSPSPNKVEWGECQWHALDMLHFVRHPCFTLPSDPAQPVGDFAHTSINIFGTEDGPHIACTAGILLIELYDVGGGREFPKTHLSFTNAHPPPTEHMVSHTTLSSVSPGKGTEPGYVRMQIFSCVSGVEPVDVPDVGALLHTVRDAAPPVALAIGTLFGVLFAHLLRTWTDDPASQDMIDSNTFNLCGIYDGTAILYPLQDLPSGKQIFDVTLSDNPKATKGLVKVRLRKTIVTSPMTRAVAAWQTQYTEKQVRLLLFRKNCGKSAVTTGMPAHLAVLESYADAGLTPLYTEHLMHTPPLHLSFALGPSSLPALPSRPQQPLSERAVFKYPVASASAIEIG